LRLPRHLDDELRRRAERLGVGHTQVARRLLADALAQLGDDDLKWDTSPWSVRSRRLRTGDSAGGLAAD
jgi:hypothetical protein